MADQTRQHHHYPHTHVHHHHHHSAGESHRRDWASANRNYFDDKAKAVDDIPGVREATTRIVNAILASYPALFDSGSTSLMEFGCGTGLISRGLYPYTKSILGVDISQGMVDHYNFKVLNEGISPDRMKAIRVEPRGNGSELGGQQFDVIVCSMAYHHIASVEDTTRMLCSLLKPGGSLLVADILKDGGKRDFPEFAQQLVPHTEGFNRDEMKALFEGAGLVQFALTNATSANMHGTWLQLFLARGAKPTWA